MTAPAATRRIGCQTWHFPVVAAMRHADTLAGAKLIGCARKHPWQARPPWHGCQAAPAPWNPGSARPLRPAAVEAGRPLEDGCAAVARVLRTLVLVATLERLHEDEARACPGVPRVVLVLARGCHPGAVDGMPSSGLVCRPGGRAVVRPAWRPDALERPCLAVRRDGSRRPSARAYARTGGCQAPKKSAICGFFLTASAACQAAPVLALASWTCGTEPHTPHTTSEEDTTP